MCDKIRTKKKLSTARSSVLCEMEDLNSGGWYLLWRDSGDYSSKLQTQHDLESCMQRPGCPSCPMCILSISVFIYLGFVAFLLSVSASSQPSRHLHRHRRDAHPVEQQPQHQRSSFQCLKTCRDQSVTLRRKTQTQTQVELRCEKSTRRPAGSVPLRLTLQRGEAALM